MNTATTTSAREAEIEITPPGGEVMAAPPSRDALVDLIERVALSDAPIERLEKLIELKERVDAEADRRAREHYEADANRAFVAAMVAVQGEVRPIVENALNTHTKSRFATLDAIHKGVKPIASKHGFASSYSQGADAPANHYRVIMDLMHLGGATRTYQADVPIDGPGFKGSENKTATHAFGSTMSYGRRYIMLMAFDISTGDDDGGNAATRDTAPTITAEQAAELRALMVKHGRDEAGFITYATSKGFPIERLEDLPASQFAASKALVSAPRKTNAAQKSTGRG